MKNIYDFYSGFEGNDEFVIEVKNNEGEVKTIIKVWIGYINEIFNNMVSNSKGFLEGVSLIYNTEVGGWYEDNNWKLINIRDFLNQLKRIEIESISKESKEIVEILFNATNFAIKNNYQIYLSLR